MLVLTRRLNETIVIAGGIEVMVVGVRGDRVRLGIKAPSHINIDRREIHERRHSDFQPTQDSALILQ